MKLDNSYKNFIIDLKQKIYSAKNKAILSTNRLMIELYFEIGEKIVKNQELQGWGKSVVEQMSKDLKNEFGEKSGYSSSNLWRMRTFYLSYVNNKYLAQLVRDISWRQNILIFEKCKDSIEVEYSLMNTSQPMRVSTYILNDTLPEELHNAFPTTQELKNIIKEDLKGKN